MARYVVVSGGGTGLGREIAARFVACGDRTMLLGRRPEVLAEAADEINANGPDPVAATWRAIDLTDPMAVGATLADLGPIDVIVANAGANESIGEPDPLRLSDVALDWLSNWRSNVLTAVMLVSALREQLTRPGGRVILISSVAAQRGGADSYSSAKSALHGWAYDLARELGPQGVTVNVVAPGYIDGTGFFNAAPLTAERHRTKVAETLVGRAGTPSDVAAAVTYLASAEAGYVTGQILSVNGGAAFGR